MLGADLGREHSGDDGVGQFFAEAKVLSIHGPGAPDQKALPTYIQKF